MYEKKYLITQIDKIKYQGIVQMGRLLSQNFLIIIIQIKLSNRNPNEFYFV